MSFENWNAFVKETNEMLKARKQKDTKGQTDDRKRKIHAVSAKRTVAKDRTNADED